MNDLIESWDKMFHSIKEYVNDHMNHVEMFQFKTKHGSVFVKLTHVVDHEDAYDKVDENGHGFYTWH